MTDTERVAWINSASYEQLLAKWRHEPLGSPWFVGETGRHLTAVMARRRTEISSAEHVATSKRIGWGEKQGADHG